MKREHEEGAAYVEFLVAFMPMFMMFLAMFQLGLMYAAKLTVGHAANRAARAAVVVLPDHPDRYGGDPINRVSYFGAGLAPSAIQGVGSVLNYWGVTSGGGSSTDGNGSARLRAIRAAASMPLIGVSPSLSAMDEKQTVVRSVGGNPWGRLGTGLVLYNRAAVSVTFPRGPRQMRFKQSWNRNENVTTRVTYLFHCGVPIVSKWMCHDYGELLSSVPSVILEQVVRRVAGDDPERFYELLAAYRDVGGRDDLSNGMEELGYAEAPYLLWALLGDNSHFTILRSESTMPNQGAAYEYRGDAR